MLRNLPSPREPGSAQEVKWEAGNPNILTVTLSNGGSVERRVTKRSFEEPELGKFGTSEYARVATSGGGEGPASIPRLSAARVLGRYRLKEDETMAGNLPSIEGIELTKFYPLVPNSFGAVEPFLIVKSRVNLTRRPATLTE
ncbi:unnamed protein product [Discosporangium mesarthrocarpum]